MSGVFVEVNAIEANSEAAREFFRGSRYLVHGNRAPRAVIGSSPKVGVAFPSWFSRPKMKRATRPPISE